MDTEQKNPECSQIHLRTGPVHSAVVKAGYRDVHIMVSEAVYGAVGGAVYEDVYAGVNRAVDKAVYEAVYEYVRRHPFNRNK